MNTFNPRALTAYATVVQTMHTLAAAAGKAKVASDARNGAAGSLTDGIVALARDLAAAETRIFTGDGRGRAARKARPTNLILSDALLADGADKGYASKAAYLTCWIAMVPARADLCFDAKGLPLGFNRAFAAVKAKVEPDPMADAASVARDIAAFLLDWAKTDDGLRDALARGDAEALADMVADHVEGRDADADAE